MMCSSCLRACRKAVLRHASLPWFLVDRRKARTYNARVNSIAQPQASDVARLIVDVASDKLASDVVMLDIRGISDFADYFVVATVESPRQMNSLVEDIEAAVKQGVGKLHHREGTAQGGWMLLDFSDVVVHLFRPETRDFYRIEEAWPAAVETVRIQ